MLKLKTLLTAKSVPRLETFSALYPHILVTIESLDHWEKCKLPPQIRFPKILNDDSEFLSKAITSHLQTHGYSVVIGRKEEEINRFVDILSLFSLSPHDLSRSAYANNGRPFVPDLVIQGTFNAEISKEDVIQATCPCTIIDLNHLTTKQTLPYHEFVVLRKNYISNEMLKIVGKKPKDNLWTAQYFFLLKIISILIS